MSTATAGGVACTGLGIAAPNGLGAGEYWPATLAGRSGIARVSRFDPDPYPATLAGEVPGFDAAEHLPSRLLPQTDHMTRLALVAADWAMADADLPVADLDDFGLGVATAASAGGFEFGQNELQNLWSKGSGHVSAYQSFAWFYAVNTGQISIRHGLRGPGTAMVTDQAGGLDAVAQARRQLRRGTTAMVAGGVDGSICPWGWTAQLASGRLSASADPGAAFLPFDPRACGHVPGEGGALLILEDSRAARDRGAPVYGEIAGYAATFDPAPGSGRAPALRRAIELALADARLTPADIGMVFADAAAVPELDAAEAEAITAVFGPLGVPVTAPKTMTGRLYAGGGALDVATALLAVRDQRIPPTVNVAADPRYELDLVTGESRRCDAGAALVIARGHGGFNSALAVTAAA